MEWLNGAMECNNFLINIIVGLMIIVTGVYVSRRNKRCNFPSLWDIEGFLLRNLNIIYVLKFMDFSIYTMTM